MQDHGWTPRQAMYQRSRTKDPLYATHCVRFRKDLPSVGEEFPEIAIFNSHNGKAAAQIIAAYFRVICSNGMVVMTEKFDSFRIQHRGYKANTSYIDYAIDVTTRNTERVQDTVHLWKELEMPYLMRRDYYKKAMDIRFPDHNDFENIVFDIPQRAQDEGSDMWSTFNRAQEYLEQGGYPVTHGVDKAPRAARELTSVTKLQEVNEKLWSMTEEFVSVPNRF